jgi:hypothetical protein
MDKDETISITIKDDEWDATTQSGSLKELAYRGSLTCKYNPDVRRVQLVRKSDGKAVVVWQQV